MHQTAGVVVTAQTSAQPDEISLVGAKLRGRGFTTLESSSYLAHIHPLAATTVADYQQHTARQREARIHPLWKKTAGLSTIHLLLLHQAENNGQPWAVWRWRESPREPAALDNAITTIYRDV